MVRAEATDGVQFGVGQADGRRRQGSLTQSARFQRAARHSAEDAILLQRLVAIALGCLPSMYSRGQFAFRLDGTADAAAGWQLTASGTSDRYAAITALGLLRLAETDQRQVLAGDTCDDLIGQLASRLAAMTSPGDVALVCWAAAEAKHPALEQALSRLAQLDRGDRSGYIVDLAWIVTALVAAREQADVEERLSSARDRLIAARGVVLYPHAIGSSPWYRAHVGSFADQVYPLQALARLHASSGDPQALAVATTIADTICADQGAGGQWWWHYDCRTGDVVERYPVYTVHQHAMAPMALLDLVEAGGPDHLEEISRGLRWLAGQAEAATTLVLDEVPVTWRKIARSDPRKLVRGLRAAATAVRPGQRLTALDQVFPPGAVDRECRPYELGWLLMAWL
jgi:hypothetical protein